MIAKTDALVLRISPFSKTSHVVSWLTPGHGKLTTIIKGAMRPKSAFLGQYDLFYTCELVFYLKERNGVHIAKECTPVSMRPEFRSSWKAYASASYICDLLMRVSMRGGHAPELYALGVSALDFLCDNPSGPSFLFWFELKLMNALGLSPMLGNCPSCNKALKSSRQLTFSLEHGGILCHSCSRSTSSSIAVSPDVFLMLKSWQEAISPRGACNTKCNHKQFLAFREILGRFILFHLDLAPQSRRIALDMTMHNVSEQLLAH
jgi:DNA repair protein RecO (recombination protein O)